MYAPKDPTFTLIDTACTLIEVGGWRLVTDPTFDEPGTKYRFGWGTASLKTSRPALSPEQVGDVNAVLLSHDQHADNFDNAGRVFAHQAPIILTTKAASRRLEKANPETLAYGMNPGDSYALSDNRRPDVVVTAVAAQHRPPWVPEFVTGQVIGFVIESEALPDGAVYITGDTVLTQDVLTLAGTHRIHTLIPHVGRAGFPRLTRRAQFSMSGSDAADLTESLDAARVLPVHSEGWSHFQEPLETVSQVFSERHLDHRLTVPQPGLAIPLV